MVRAAVAGLQQTSVVFEEAAATLGAPPWTRLRRVTLPLIAANLIAGLLLTFSFSMLEVSDSLMLAQQAERFTITKTIYELLQLIGNGSYVAAELGAGHAVPGVNDCAPVAARAAGPLSGRSGPSAPTPLSQPSLPPSLPWNHPREPAP